jgi:glucose-6-phosphate isomerase
VEEAMKSSVLQFDLKTGLSPERKPLQRFAGEMRGMYNDTAAMERAIQAGNPLIYEFYDLGIEETAVNLAYGTSMLFPGKIGNEFFMTKGHFHRIPDAAEIYYCLSGYGMMLMENPGGDTEYRILRPGAAVCVPGRFAHRSINLSAAEKLVTFFTLRADAGHDYGSIEKRGFRKLVVDDGNGSFALIDNPKWNG